MLIAGGAFGGIGLIALAVAIALQVVTPPAYAHGVSTSDIAGLAGAGATLLLADFTALLAWITRRSIDATQREADVATQALAASNRQAEIAERALRAVQDQARLAQEQVDATNELARAAQEQVRATSEQAEIAQDQVKATNDQAAIAQAQLAASTRPMLAEPRETHFINVSANLNQAYEFQVKMVNIGPGPAFVRKGMFSLGVAHVWSKEIVPKIVAPNGEVLINFLVHPTKGEAIAVTNAILQDSDQLNAGALYHDISGNRAWRSRGRIVRRGTNQWLLTDVEVADIELTFLD